jgi:hypothetical protein
MRAATFGAEARFDGATFAGEARLEPVTFKGYAVFGGATFTRGANIDGVRVLNMDIPHERAWPGGGTVRIDPDDLTSVRLVRGDPVPLGEPDRTVSTDHEEGDT